MCSGISGLENFAVILLLMWWFTRLRYFTKFPVHGLCKELQLLQVGSALCYAVYSLCKGVYLLRVGIIVMILCLEFSCNYYNYSFLHVFCCIGCKWTSVGAIAFQFLFFENKHSKNITVFYIYNKMFLQHFTIFWGSASSRILHQFLHVSVKSVNSVSLSTHLLSSTLTIYQYNTMVISFLLATYGTLLHLLEAACRI